MGWTFTHKSSHVSASDFIKNEVLVWNSPNYSYRVIDGGVVNFKTYYGAVEKIDLTSGEREVFAVVILLSYSKDYHNFGYKSMAETCGPYEQKCPKRILDLLTTTDNENALAWRDGCLKNIEKRKEGTKIKENMEIMYANKKYKVIQSLGKKGFVVVSEYGTVYRLKCTQAKKSTIVSQHSA